MWNHIPMQNSANLVCGWMWCREHQVFTKAKVKIASKSRLRPVVILEFYIQFCTPCRKSDVPWQPTGLDMIDRIFKLTQFIAKGFIRFPQFSKFPSMNCQPHISNFCLCHGKITYGVKYKFDQICHLSVNLTTLEGCQHRSHCCKPTTTWLPLVHSSNQMLLRDGPCSILYSYMCQLFNTPGPLLTKGNKQEYWSADTFEIKLILN